MAPREWLLEPSPVVFGSSEVLSSHDLAHGHARAAAALLPEGSGQRVGAWVSAAVDAARARLHDEAEADLARAQALERTDDDRLDTRLGRAQIEACADPRRGLALLEPLLDELAARPEGLSESTRAQRAIDLAVDLLACLGDRRALDVQRCLFDEKLARFGECPAASLERHNLGVVHARLGDADEARKLFTRALRELRRYHAHEWVELAERSLARLDAEHPVKPRRARKSPPHHCG